MFIRKLQQVFGILRTTARLASFDKENNTKEELQELFEMTRRLGEEDYQEEILAAGVERKLPYFLIEQYQRLQQEEGRENELAQLREEIIKNGNQESHYRLAIIDYVQNTFTLGEEASTDEVASPLITYLQTYGDVDKENAWRVQLQVATLYKNAGKDEKAVAYLQKALENAPSTHTEEVQMVLDSLKVSKTS